MSKKNRKNVANEAAAETAVAETSTPVAPAAEPTTVQHFELADIGDRKFRRGFETALINELGNGGGTAQELTDRMLASGEYAKVAPAAAAARPLKPTAYLLKIWTVAKIVRATEIALTADEPAVEVSSEELVAQ